MRRIVGLLILLTSAGGGAAAEHPWVEIDTRGVRESWSDEDFLDARPMPMPAVDLRHLRGAGFEPVAAPARRGGTGRRASPPSLAR